MKKRILLMMLLGALTVSIYSCTGDIEDPSPVPTNPPGQQPDPTPAPAAEPFLLPIGQPNQ